AAGTGVPADLRPAVLIGRRHAKNPASVRGGGFLIRDSGHSLRWVVRGSLTVCRYFVARARLGRRCPALGATAGGHGQGRRVAGERLWAVFFGARGETPPGLWAYALPGG